MTALDRLVSEVFAVAKQDLAPGDVLDGIGGCCFYSLIDRYEIAEREDLLPIGLAKGAKVIRLVKKDSPISCSDVQLKEPSIILDLRRLQNKWTRGQITETELLAIVDSFAVD
jgi:predicted homoserine dehydrogenase-like protein